MRSLLLLRALALAGVGLLAALGALTLHARGRNSRAALPQPVRWYTARAAPYGPIPGRKKGACGVSLTAPGVAHPVLPCGVKIYIAYDGSRPILTQVIDRGPTVPGHEFDVTKTLADRIGLHGTQTIRWGFAR